MVGGFAEMSEDVIRICDITAHDLARTHVSYYNDDAKRTKGMYRQRIQKAWGHTACAIMSDGTLMCLGRSTVVRERAVNFIPDDPVALTFQW